MSEQNSSFKNSHRLSWIRQSFWELLFEVSLFAFLVFRILTKFKKFCPTDATTEIATHSLHFYAVWLCYMIIEFFRNVAYVVLYANPPI